MKTDELIDRLTGELAPVSRGAVPRTLALGLGAGALVSFAAMWLWLGIRPDLTSAATTSAYWMKFIYTLSLGCLAFWAVERLARPGAGSRLQMTLLAIPVVVLLVLALIQIDGVPRATRMHLMMGASAECLSVADRNTLAAGFRGCVLGAFKTRAHAARRCGCRGRASRRRVRRLDLCLSLR